jgi:adenylate cyclase
LDRQAAAAEPDNEESINASCNVQGQFTCLRKCQPQRQAAPSAAPRNARMSATTPDTTVVFADLAGSTRIYEALGNAAAAEAIARLTQWIGGVCEAHGGRAVKMLGDGVLAVFPQAPAAVAAMVALQRTHARQLPDWPNHIRMRLQVGVAAGEVIEVDGDCYGDAVNVASRLADLAGPDHIWATRTVIAQLGSLDEDVRVRGLGSIPLRGRSQAADIFQVDWEQDIQSRYLTRPATLSDQVLPKPTRGGGLRLSCLGRQRRFGMADLPIELGRADEAEFQVEDQRVSRVHARIEWRHGSLVLSDTSSYGTWVRFAGGATALTLRRDECVLIGAGELALGAPFEDVTAPIVRFQVLPGGR